MLVESRVNFGGDRKAVADPLPKSSAIFRQRAVTAPSGERAALPLKPWLAILFAKVT